MTTGRLVGLELLRISLPLVAPWVSGAGTFEVRDSVLVLAVVTGGGPDGLPVQVEGWGECPALPAPTYSEEYTEGALAVSQAYLVPALLRAQPASWEEAAEAMSATRGHGMAKTAFEVALLDAWLQLAGSPLAEYFAGVAAGGRGPGAAGSPPGCEPSLALPRASVPAGVALGLSSDAEGLVESVAAYVAAGYQRVKLKVRPGWDRVPLAAIRERWPALLVFADANGAYAPLGVDGAARELEALDELGLACLEQPLADDDLLGHARLARRLRVPLCLDEALVSTAMLAAALELGACSVVNVKAGRMGGYHAALAAYRLCAGAGVHMWCGGMVEAGIGRAANLALASLPGFDLPGDLSASSRFFAEDVAGPIDVGPGGLIEVPTGPGLGVEVHRTVIDRVCTWREWWAA